MEYPSVRDFYHHSNTHDPDQDGFHDLYCHDFIHAISRVVRHKLLHHHLDPYQCAAFQRSIVCCNVGEEEANPTLELAMEYAGVLGTIIFDKSCCLHDLTEAQVGRNQFAINMVVDQLDKRINEVDGRADHASEYLSALEGKVTDMEAGYTKLLVLGWCERASCYARANLPRTVPKSYWSWPVAICEGSRPTCAVVSPNMRGVHVPWRLYACLIKTEVPD